tara:strand:- start:2986 stop:4221 length:1236 start_codon:yes stop_codon:yes gene_type:complete
MKDHKIKKNNQKIIQKNTTFTNNRIKPIHSWYSYVEGFSWDFVQNKLNEFKIKKDQIVLDPFSGSGTTLVEASVSGVKSIGYEINPFLTFVSKTKTNFPFSAEKLNDELLKLDQKIKKESTKMKKITPEDVGLTDMFATDKIFSKKILPKVLTVRKYLSDIQEKKIRDFFTLSFCSMLVEISNYRRGPDLAMKKEPLDNAPVFERFLEKSSSMITDIEEMSIRGSGKTNIHNGDSRKLEKLESELVDLVITSPPYLNGTNYFRNTKLELWFTKHLKKTEDLRKFREQAITGGINDAFRSKHIESTIPEVQKIVSKIEKNQYDLRIPIMVSTYFEEINLCFENLFRVMKSGGKCFWVVGDSAFSGIKIPTDVISENIAKEIGFKHERTDIVRERKSRSGLKLHEAVIVLKKE